MYTSYLLMLGMKLIQYNKMTKFKQNQNDIYELNLKIHDETKSTITFRVYFLYHSGQCNR